MEDGLGSTAIGPCGGRQHTRTVDVDEADIVSFDDAGDVGSEPGNLGGKAEKVERGLASRMITVLPDRLNAGSLSGAEIEQGAIAGGGGHSLPTLFDGGPDEVEQAKLRSASIAELIQEKDGHGWVVSDVWRIAMARTHR